MSAVLCFVVLVLAVTIMLLGLSAQAQTCAQATLFYNDAEKQKLYVEADRFADTEFGDPKYARSTPTSTG